VAPLTELAPLLDRGRGPDRVQDPTAAALSTTREVTGALAARARRRLLVGIVDDAHDLDRWSADLFDAVLTNLDETAARAPMQLVMIIAARVGNGPDFVAARALRLSSARSVNLGPLDVHDVHELIREAGYGPSPPLAGRILEDTAGLPLLVDAAIERLATPGEGLRPRLRSSADAVRVRFAGLDQEAIRVLQAAAILGEPWTVADLARVRADDIDVVHRVVTSAVAGQVLQGDADGFRFAHPLLRADLLERLSGRQREALHRAAALAIAGDAGFGGPLDDTDLVRVADHLVRASGVGRVSTADRGPVAVPPDEAHVLGRAGAVAERWGAWRQAACFLGAAADEAEASGRGPVGARFLAAGRSAYLDGDQDGAAHLLAKSLEHCGREGDRAAALAAAVYLSRSRIAAHGRPGRSIDLTELEAALRGASASDSAAMTPGLVEAEAALAEALIVTGTSERALALVADARSRASAPGTDAGSMTSPLARLDFAEGIHRLHQLDLSAADACFRSGAQRSAAAGNDLAGLYNRSRLALSALVQGAVGHACAEAAAVEVDAVKLGFTGEAGLAAAQQSLCQLLSGTAHKETATERAVRSWRTTGSSYIATMVTPVLVTIAARTRGTEHVDESALPVSSVVATLGAVEAYDLDNARVRARTAGWRHGMRGGVNLTRDSIVVALVEVGDLTGAKGLVMAASEPVAVLVECGVQVLVGWPTMVARLAAIVARHGGDLDGARRHLDRAVALCDREGLRAERAKVLLEFGRCEIAGGNTAEAALMFAEALRGFDECEMHGWVARADALAQEHALAVPGPSGLSRERTIFTNDIVGSTASNAELGDALYLEQLHIHDRLVRARLSEYGGLEIKHTGDGINAAFTDPTDAARAALALLVDFADWQRAEPDIALQVRIGLAHGPVTPAGGDFFGLVQSQAARLCALAPAGSVVATAAVVAHFYGDDVIARPLGAHELKGHPKAIEVFQLGRV
jgi:class 3 adenylate cyclase